jgi:hypothetical protein
MIPGLPVSSAEEKRVDAADPCEEVDEKHR